MKRDNTKRIDQYLSGELSDTERNKFEAELKTNPELQKELDLQRNIYEAAKRTSVRNTVKSVGKKHHLINLTKWIVGGVAIIALVASAVYFSTQVNNTSEKANESTTQPQMGLKSKELIKELPREMFTWNGEDTVYLSESGVLISVPNEALLQNGKPYKGKATIEWQEAVDGATIMKSGLSTMADSNLLETQGMFSFRVQTEEGELLEIDPEVGVYVQVPVDEIKPGMELYEGVYDKDSIINWVNPKPLEKLPVPVDMSELDFYPEGYEDTLDKLKLSQRKKYRDSLYLACEFETENVSQEEGYSGQQLYEATCALCHLPNKNMTGPKLKSVRQKWEEGGAKDGSIYDWVQNWQVAVANDPYAKKVAAWSPTAMSQHQYLTKEQIEKIFDYIDYEWKPEDKINAELLTYIRNSLTDNTLEMVDSVYSTPFEKYIPPSKVLAFWNEKFNNTILATRDFEKRMRTIHKTCDESLLKLYTRNIDKPLYYIDSLAVARGYKQFETFFAERVGKVELDNPHLKELQKFYERGIKELRDHLNLERERKARQERKWDNKVTTARTEENVRSANRKALAFQEEASLNHEHVRKQLGFTQNIKITKNTIIVNIDREVYAATRNRKTTKISFNGKTSIIKYNDFSLNVKNYEDYNRLFVYLLPDKLNSYQRIDHKKGKVDYPLNDKIIYDVVVLGINETGYFYHEIKKVNEGAFGEINLTSIAESEFEKRISELNQNRLEKPMKIKDELAWLKLEKENYKVQRLRQEKKRFLERMRNVVFPCYSANKDGEEDGEVVIETPAFL